MPHASRVRPRGGATPGPGALLPSLLAAAALLAVGFATTAGPAAAEPPGAPAGTPAPAGPNVEMIVSQMLAELKQDAGGEPDAAACERCAEAAARLAAEHPEQASAIRTAFATALPGCTLTVTAALELSLTATSSGPRPYRPLPDWVMPAPPGPGKSPEKPEPQAACPAGGCPTPPAPGIPPGPQQAASPTTR